MVTDPRPNKPIFALTLALAGKRNIDEAHRDQLIAGLQGVFDTVSVRLGELVAKAARPDDDLALRFSGEPARLTLVTGLADGVDQIGGDVFVRRSVDHWGVRRLLGAVLPCDREQFVQNSHVDDVVTFDRLWEDCGFILDLAADMPLSPRRRSDGPLTDAEVHTARRVRGDAFTAQSEVMLRNADILLAVDAPHDVGRTGGTRESIRKALDVGLPVVLLRLGEPGMAVLRTRAEFDDPSMLTGAEAKRVLIELVDEVTGFLATRLEDAYARSLVADLFASEPPPAGGLPGLWKGFEAWFRPRDNAGSPQISSPRPAAYWSFKERAGALSAAYAGRYRGSFLAGYGLAIVAIAAAVISLAINAAADEVDRLARPMLMVLLILGIAKVSALSCIYLLARRAHDQRLAHRAADFRYLTERLRAMCFLPEVGWMRSPANWSLPYTTRLAAQGLMDRLLASILRQADPLRTLSGVREGKVIRLQLSDAEEVIRGNWLADQERYHRHNHATLEAMSLWLENANRSLNALVVLAAGIDLAILVTMLVAGRPTPLIRVLDTYVAPLAISIAAILPAIVASLNGVRFQSECSRLADRSKQMAVELHRLANPGKDRGGRRPAMIEMLRLAEDASRLTLGEVAEWSAIYGKDFPEI